LVGVTIRPATHKGYLRAAHGQRNVDKALWAYGKFIGENNFPLEAIR
jgi:hypothetical protein